MLVLISMLVMSCTSTPALSSVQATPQPGIRTRQEAFPENALKMSPEYDPAFPVLHISEWQDPVPLPGSVNTAGAEDSPFITPDGSTLYFFFTPVSALPAEQQLFDGVTGIYVANFLDGSWGQVQRLLLHSPDKLALEGCPFVKGDTLCFCSVREGYTGIQIFTAQIVNNARSLRKPFSKASG